MKFYLKALAFSVGALALGVSVANANPVGSVASTEGVVLVMRGNSVQEIKAGDAILKGDRVLSRTGSSATFSGGSVLGSDMSVLAKGDLSGSSFTSKAGGGSKDSGGSDSSSLFYSSSNSRDRDNDKGKDSHKGKDSDKGKGKDNDRDRDYDGGWDNDKGKKDGHNEDYPWHGTPKDSDPCSY